jgi:hypothetical protein
MEMSVAIFAMAYELKDGGFRAVVKNNQTGEVQRGEIRESLASAKLDAQQFAFNFLAGRPYRAGAYRNPRNAWKMNYWMAA